MGDFQIDDDNKKQLDTNIRKMLDAGASQDDVMSYAKDFNSHIAKQTSQPLAPSHDPIGVLAPKQPNSPYLKGLDFKSVTDAVKADKSQQEKNSSVGALYNFAVGSLSKLGSGLLSRAAQSVPSSMGSVGGAPSGTNAPSTDDRIQAAHALGGAASDFISKARSESSSRENEASKEFDLSKGVGHNLKALGYQIPALGVDLGAAALTGGASLFSQGEGSAIEQLKNNPEASKLTPTQAEGYVMTSGLVNGLLMKLGFDKIFKSTGITDQVSKKITSEVTSELIDKGVKATAQDIQDLALRKATAFMAKAKNVGIKAATGAITGGVISTAQSATDDAIKLLVDKGAGKDVFNDEDIKQNFGKHLLNSLVQGVATGGVLGLAHGAFENTNKAIRNEVAKAQTPEELAKIEQHINEQVEIGNLTPEEAHAANGKIQEYAQIAAKIPEEVSSDRKYAIMGGIEQREGLKNQINEAQTQLNNIDEAFRPQQSAHVDLLRGKLEQTHDYINSLVTGETPKYIEENGIQYKEVGGEKIPISKEHYEAGKAVEDAKKPIEESKPTDLQKVEESQPIDEQKVSRENEILPKEGEGEKPIEDNTPHEVNTQIVEDQFEKPQGEEPNKEGRNVVTLNGATEAERLADVERRKKQTSVTDEVQKTNSLVQDVKSFYDKPGTFRNSKEGRAELNNLKLRAGENGHVVKDGKLQKTGKNGRLREVTYNNKADGEMAINPKGKPLMERSPEVAQAFESLIDSGNEKLEVKTQDGKKMTDEQLAGAIQDVLDGIHSNRATAYLDAIENGLNTSGKLMPVRDAYGEVVGVPLDELLGVQKEKLDALPEHEIDNWLKEEGSLSPEFDKLVHDNIDNLIEEYGQEPNESELGQVDRTAETKGSAEVEHPSEVKGNQADADQNRAAEPTPEQPSVAESGEPAAEQPNLTENQISAEEESPKSETVIGEDGKEYTSLKREIYDAERDAEGKPIADTSTGKSAEERQAETFAKIKSGEITQDQITDITHALASGEDVVVPKGFKPEQVEHILLYDKVRLENEAKDISEKLSKATDPKEVTDLTFKQAQNDLLLEDNYQAARNLHSEWGRQGQAMQQSMADDYSLANILGKFKASGDKSAISTEQRAKLEELTKIIADKDSKLAEVEKAKQEVDEALLKIQEEKAHLEAQNKLYEEKLRAENNKSTVRVDKKASLEKQKKATVDQIKAKYKRLSGQANSGLNFNLLELAPDIAKLARLHVESGIIELEELIDKIHSDLSEFIPDLDKRQLRDVFSGYGKISKLSTDAVDIELSKLRQKAKAVSGLEDVRDLHQAPLKSGATFRKPTQEVLDIRKEIMNEMRKQGIDVKKATQKNWETALESFKTRQKNRIEYLENIKKTNDLDKFIKDKTREKLKLDPEAKMLKAEAQAAKWEVDKMMRLRDFQNMSRFQKGVHYAQRFSKGVLISNPATLVKIIGSVAWRAAYKPIHASTMYMASKLFPKLGKVQGINSLGDLGSHLSTYYSTMFSREMMKGVADTFKRHNSQEDMLYGKNNFDQPIPDVKVTSLKSFMQASFFNTLKLLERNASLHGAEKNIAAKPEFEAWKNTIGKNLIREGVTPAEFGAMETQEVVNQLAFQKSLRARFMQENKVAGAQKMIEIYLRNKNSDNAAEVLQALLPITKISSNYIGESLEKLPVTGVAPALFHAVFKKGNLTEAEKGNLLRAISYQGVGVASYLLGAYAYQSINPFFQSSGKKYADKNGKDLPEDKNDIGIIPEIWAHSPEAMLIRAGASHRWVWHKFDDEKNTGGTMDAAFNHFIKPMWENNLAMLEGSPYISTAEQTVAPILGHGDVGKAAANFVKGRIPFSTTAKEISENKIPILNKIMPETSKKLGEAMGLHEKETKLSDVGLKPHGFSQNMRIGVPGWREDVIKELEQEKADKAKETKQKSKESRKGSAQRKREKSDNLKKFNAENL